MKNQQARFILGAYRPDGRDASDPTFHEALAQAEHDPELRAWFESERKFDAVCAAKLREIKPPPGLREAVFSGVRVTVAHSKRRSSTGPLWFAAAAVLVVLALATLVGHRTFAVPTESDLAAFAQRDVADHYAEHLGDSSVLHEVQSLFASTQVPLTKSCDFNCEELRSHNCRVVQLDGREVFEICLQRDGTSFHAYIGQRSDFACDGAEAKARLQVRGQLASATWADAKHVYTVVTRAGAEALRRLI